MSTLITDVPLVVRIVSTGDVMALNLIQTLRAFANILAEA